MTKTYRAYVSGTSKESNRKSTMAPPQHHQQLSVTSAVTAANGLPSGP
ncbi:MAG: hypothetical protein ACJ0G5_06850 [Alphaproteobacteria bacterium]